MAPSAFISLGQVIDLLLNLWLCGEAFFPAREGRGVKSARGYTLEVTSGESSHGRCFAVGVGGKRIELRAIRFPLFRMIKGAFYGRERAFVRAQKLCLSKGRTEAIGSSFTPPNQC